MKSEIKLFILLTSHIIKKLQFNLKNLLILLYIYIYNTL